LQHQFALFGDIVQLMLALAISLGVGALALRALDFDRRFRRW